jgi:hypothetical protein
MNDSKKMAIILAVAFFLAGTMLNIDYARWNEETHNEYQGYMQNIMEGNISVTIPVTKEQFEEYAREEGNYTFYYFRVGKSFEEWKQTNGKSYWKDLAGRLSVYGSLAYDETLGVVAIDDVTEVVIKGNAVVGTEYHRYVTKVEAIYLAREFLVR